MSGYGRGIQKQAAWNSGLDAYWQCCSQGARILSEMGVDFPSVQLGAVRVPVLPNAHVDVSELEARMWPRISADFEEVRAACPAHGLPLFARHLPLMAFLRFVDLRLRASEAAFLPTHWLPRLRLMLIKTSTFLLEALVESELHRTQGQVVARPSELYGAAGIRRSPHQHALRMSIMEMIYCYGSREVITRSLGRGKGTASQLAAVFVRLYRANVQASFGQTASVAMHWDSSCHDGHDIQTGCAILPSDAAATTSTAAVLAPVAMYQNMDFCRDLV